MWTTNKKLKWTWTLSRCIKLIHSKTHSLGFEGWSLLTALLVKSENQKSDNLFSSWLLGFLRKGATQIENLSEACFRDIANTGSLYFLPHRRLNLHQILSLSAPSLTKLQLHYCYINAEKVAFQHFPRSLKKLSLEGCELFNLPADKSIFKHIDSHMPDLEELDLTRLTLTEEIFWNSMFMKRSVWSISH